MSTVDPETNQLHLMFFPLMDIGHMLPAIDMARLFAQQGVKITIVTTPLNVHFFTKAISKCNDGTSNRDAQITIRVLQFPAKEADLPEGIENVNQITTTEIHRKFFNAVSMLQEPAEQLVQESRPSGLVADMFFPWTTEVAAKFGIPRLVFYGTSFISLCVLNSLVTCRPHKNVSSDTEPFTLPGLPHQFTLTRLQLPPHIRLEFEDDFIRLLRRARDSAETSYGVVMNSFYELEPAYADLYKDKYKAWHIGPVSLGNKEFYDKAQRGKKSSIDEHECLKWLDMREPNSVLYICFGSVARLTEWQVHEMAMGLEASGQQFIWVIKGEDHEYCRGKANVLELNECRLPRGFEERINGKGLMIRGWAPQMLILDHKAIGGFVTHCGWNSILEGVSAGLPMVTWPMFAEQFFNEKLVTEILKIGIGVGTRQWIRPVGDSVKRDAIDKVVRRLMIGEEAEEMRSRARSLAKMARQAIEEGGSSYQNLTALIQELRSYGGKVQALN